MPAAGLSASGADLASGNEVGSRHQEHESQGTAPHAVRPLHPVDELELPQAHPPAAGAEQLQAASGLGPCRQHSPASLEAWVQSSATTMLGTPTTSSLKMGSL